MATNLLNISDTNSTSVSAAAIFSAEDGCGRPAPKRKDIMTDGRFFYVGNRGSLENELRWVFQLTIDVVDQSSASELFEFPQSQNLASFDHQAIGASFRTLKIKDFEYSVLHVSKSFFHVHILSNRTAICHSRCNLSVNGKHGVHDFCQ